jgi:dihydroxyacetone kinase-like protein
MKKLIRDPQTLVRDALDGLAAAHAGLLRVQGDPPVILRADAPVRGKVGLVSGGGSGHEPLHGGFVGFGMLDAAVPGPVFTSPTPDPILEATRTVDGGAGVLHIVKNYTGDVLNFETAAELALAEDLAVETVVPHAGTPSFDISDHEVEIGIGIHGEPGRERIEIEPVDGIVARLMAAILDDLPVTSSDEVLLFVNGMGGTPLLELYIVFDAAARVLGERNVHIARSLVGDYVTSLDMQGVSITVLKLDDEMKALWDAPVETAALRWGR